MSGSFRFCSALKGTNFPSTTDWSTVFTIPMDNNKRYQVQLGFVLGSTNIYIRYCRPNSGWSDWRTI